MYFISILDLAKQFLLGSVIVINRSDHKFLDQFLFGFIAISV